MTSHTDLIETLSSRGFIHQSTDLEGLRAHLASGSRTVYLGFDATADSLHVGHLQGLMLMRWLQKAGHRPILLIGGATTRIGDPSFRDESRPVLTNEQIDANILGITRTFERYLTLGDAAGQVVDNAEWLDQIGYLQFLNDVGRYFSINRLLTFDAVRQRLDRENSLSFLEFGYTLLQAHDFTELAKRHDCTVQLGGADQWANIINGVELGRRRDGRELFGLTMPLLATADGKKMGKSLNGAVWLDGNRLSPFDFWQFWRNCDDRDVRRFLALFTELPLDEVDRLANVEGAAINEAKIVLANHVTALAHGQQAAEQANAAAQGLFAGGAQASDLPVHFIERSKLTGGLTVAAALVECGMERSLSAVRRLAQGRGLRLNGETLQSGDEVLDPAQSRWHVSLGRKRHIHIEVKA
ncbi:tyrosine--tRNA ligase [Pseudomonas sp. MTM4]|uniref:tyrosine--tRNA ligase n=1 Tax=unclassified Pseudomonas TaxID=196821 RepID=UPI0018D22B2B|nr:MULTISPECIES: tyrosine--tRNA ligase [unclassified Pseudomonas]MBC8651971.1 tyrosine--tRNA ligase [Pseudomonas sp. MT4]QXY91228.1 tyrosine--tRNA ligase [Pseudomonas sp. MTM4]